MTVSLVAPPTEADVRHIVKRISRPVTGRPTLAAHRGLRWSGAADNSRASIRRAVENGIDCVEIDIQLSADGVPVVFHDDGLGRSTNIAEHLSRSDVYSPFTGKGYNPKVEMVSWHDTIKHLYLKEEHGETTGEHVLDLALLLQYIRLSKYNVVVLLDVKTAAAVPACFEMIRHEWNHAGIHALEWCIWKLDASWYPTAEDLERSAWYSAAKRMGYPPLMMPVIRPETALTYDYMSCAKSFASRPYTMAFEVGLRSRKGLLQDVVDWIRSAECPVKALAFFAPLGDVHPPDQKEILFDLDGFNLGCADRHWINEWSFSDDRAPRSIHAALRPGESVDGRDWRCNIDTYLAMGYTIIITDHADRLKRHFEGGRGIGGTIQSM